MKMDRKPDDVLRNLEIAGSIIQFGVIEGTVLASSKHSDVMRSAGSYPTINQGHIALSPAVHTRIQLVHEIWIFQPDGKEVPVRLAGVDIPLREGQEVALLFANIEGKVNEWLVLINHNTETRHDLCKLPDFMKKSRIVVAAWGGAFGKFVLTRSLVIFALLSSGFLLAMLLLAMMNEIFRSGILGWIAVIFVLGAILVINSFRRFLEIMKETMKAADNRRSFVLDKISNRVEAIVKTLY